jgi:UDP-glucose 4-epimerase
MQRLLDGERLGARNLGSGRGTSNREVVKAVERATGLPVRVHEAARRPGDPPELVADCLAARSELGWRPRHSDLDTIVATAWAWLRKWRRL